MRDYAVLVLYANPKEGQSLEDCEQLLLKEMEKIRQGDFADWLMDAVIDNMRLQQTRNFESNRKSRCTRSVFHSWKRLAKPG